MTDRPTAIFVLGILERSGTNYLFDLIRVHPDVGFHRPIWEDKLLRPAHLIEQYVDTVVSGWDSRWKVPETERTALLRALGEGIQQFLIADADRPFVITKTPSVDNLPMFFDLMPDAKLVVLVRDGRSVAESGARSFGWSYPLTIKQWADAARTILAADPVFRAAGHSYTLVRYEDVVADLRGALTDVLVCCGLDPSRYDFARAERMPVRGSSTARPDPGGAVNWTHLARPDDFDPTERFADWDGALRHLYAELAGDVHTALGYPLEPAPPMTAAVRAQLVRYRAELARKVGRRKAQHYASRVRQWTGIRR